MEVVNYNDIFRNFIFDKLATAKENNDESEINLLIDYLYDEIGNNKNYMSIMYLTSYIVNYVAFKKYPNDAELINAMDFLNGIASIDELIDVMDLEMFETLCDDTFLFSSSDYYIKKKVVMQSLDNIKKIMSIAPSFIYDVIKYSIKYTPSLILDEYNKQKKLTNDENVAMEDAVCFGTDFLIELENNDIDNYKEMMHNILKVYYLYNKYLLSVGESLDEYASDIMGMIETDIDNLILYSANNSSLLEPIVRDYLSYMLLPSVEKQKAKEVYIEQLNKNYVNHYEISNYNTFIRKNLYNTFGYCDAIDMVDDDYYISKLDDLKANNNLDDIIKVLYIDNMSILYYDYLSFPTDLDIKLDFEYFIEFKNINDYKMFLLEDDCNFFTAIANSIYFYTAPLIEKKNILKTLKKEDAYDVFLVNNYLQDFIEFSRKYDLSDITKIYYDLCMSLDDKKATISAAAEQLQSDLLDIELSDKNEYADLIYDIAKVYYEYNKYLLDNNVNVKEENVRMIKMMEKNLDNFLLQLNENCVMKDALIYSFYEYISCDIEKKQKVLSYFKKLEDSGKVKIFSKKNKNS